MRIIVSKFGGSSTAGPAQFQQILKILRSSSARRCVVLSAPGAGDGHSVKVTSLLDACWQCRADAGRLEDTIRRVVGRFRAIAGPLSLFDPADRVCDEIRRAVGISRAHTLSRGEYLCALLFSAYSGIPMLDAAKLIAFDAAGRLDEGRTRRQLEQLIDARAPMVIPGFYGADPDGALHTFPRNGSDITGALAAAGLRAALYENWTDVPGLMSADPAVVPRARLIPQVSYRQMRALARAGARVLHPACLDPVAMAGIPTRLRSAADTRCFGTLIDEHTAAVVPCIAAWEYASSQGAERAACVSVFGLPAKAVLGAIKDLNPLRTEADDICVRAAFPAGRCDDAVRELHGRLIE